MKVFLSWSGEQSHRVAQALRDWLPLTLQAVEPWLSSGDIPLGSRWTTELATILKNADAGIICLTRENINSQWLTYEAGALYKHTRKSFLCIYTLDMPPSDVTGPLMQFQCTIAEKKDTFQLLQSLNNLLDNHKIEETALQKIFELTWFLLEERLKEIKKYISDAQSGKRSLEDKVDEVLELTRSLVKKSESQPALISNPVSSSYSIQHSYLEGKPKVFIGSSTEGLNIAEAIQLGLESVSECTIWHQSVFDLAKSTFENLVDFSREFDFAILILTPDDLVITRGAKISAPGGNLLFELGLFTGVLGRARTFMVYCKDDVINIPSDLAGVTAATFGKRNDGNLHAALGPVCTRIKQAMGVD